LKEILMTNIFSSTRSVRFAAHRPLILPSALAAGAVLILSGQIAQAQPLLAGEKTYSQRDKGTKTSHDESYTERSSMGTSRSTMSSSVETVPTPQSMSRAMSQPLRNRRVMMVLPLRTGENWKAAPDFTQSFVRQTDLALRRALANTGRFTTLEVRRFNPVLMRAVQDGVATSDELDTLLSTPTTPNASLFLSKITFNKAPLHVFTESAVIGSFVLESMAVTNKSVSVKVTGRIYSADGQTPLRSLSATTTVPLAAASGDILASASTAAMTAIDRVIAELLRTPTEAEMVSGEAAPVATTIVTPVEVPVTTASGTALPGTPIRGSTTHSPGTPATNNNGTGQPTASIPVSGVISTVTEIPPAETFPTAPSTTADTTAPTSTDTTVTPSIDGATTDTTVTDPTSGASGTPSDAFPDMSAGAAISNNETATSTSENSTATGNAAAQGKTLPTPTDNAATDGTTADGAASEGTVGAMSTESHGQRTPSTIPSNDDELGFEN
jgi:hypothetical protein